jgi:hypothetical protein
MRILLYCIGALAILCGCGLVAVTATGKFTPLTGYSGGLSVAVGGLIVLAAAKKNYRGEWPFLTGTVLSTLAFAGFGADIDGYRSGGEIRDFLFGAFLAVMFLSFGLLSLSSSYKLHRCLVRLASPPSESSHEDYCI